MSRSYDSSAQPLNGQSPYGSGDPYYQSSTGFLPPQRPKKGTSPWIKFGIPVAILIIAGVVVGAVVGTHNNKNKSAVSSTSGGTAAPAAVSSAVSAKAALGRFATSTDSQYLEPIYPSTTNTAVFTSPTFIATDDSSLAWPKDPFAPANPAPTTVRTDRPRLIAPSYKWAALPQLIKNDPYMSGWNATIFGNASDWYALPPVPYVLDGGNGILDIARSIKQRVKAFSYVYRMTNDTKWVDRTWSELQNAAGNGSSSFGPSQDRWNSIHFLDTAELTAAFGIAYDWLNDVWTDDQKASIRETMITYGLTFGVNAFSNSSIGWWSDNIQGNWNCVCNGGLTMGALAILGDDDSGIAQQILGLTVPNALGNCIWAVSDDGTWSETPDYWYFGSMGHAEMTSALMTAAGSDFGMLNNNPGFKFTGQFHMALFGPGSLFNYGDTGPNKFSTTANGMFLYGDQYQMPVYQLFQREQFDAADPWSMFWYDPTVSGAFWDGLPLDFVFTNVTDQWMSMRSSWTDQNALYAGIKATTLQGHQTHNDLDAGDFVIDALGTRWAGELGDGNYNADGYFTSDAQNAERWLYYRKRSEGQNVILVNKNNQNVNAQPTIQHGSSNTTQGSSTVFEVPDGSTAFFTADLVSAYNDTSSYSRGLRMINNRKQVLLQDDITASQPIEWRMHTNATVNIDSSGTFATLTIGSQTMIMQILNMPSGAKLGTADPVRFSTDPPLPTGPGDEDQPNTGVTVVTIDMPAGTYSLQVLFNPQWPGMSSSDFKTPPSVPLSQWTLNSHN